MAKPVALDLSLLVFTAGLVTLGVEMSASRLLEPAFGNSQLVWAALIGLILIATVFSYTTGVMAARALGSKVASFISLTEVLFAVLWAWLLLSELPGPVQLLGGLLIVGGVVLVRVDELRSARR